MKPLAARRSLAHRGADHRRSVRIGIGVSAVVHAALLAWITFPGTPASEASPEPHRTTQSDALELIAVRLPDAAPEPVDPAEASSAGATAAGEQAESDAVVAEADAPSSDAAPDPAPDRFGETVERLAIVAGPTMATTEIGALGDVRAIEPSGETATTGHEGHLHTLAEEGQGFWGRLADGIDIAVSGGGLCPLDDDLIGIARDRGFVIPQARGGGLNLPRAGGFSIPRSRGLGVRLPGGIGR